MINHEESYKKIRVSALVHRSRLKSVVHIFEKLIPKEVNNWADFGTSTGFIPEQLFKNDVIKVKEFTGFDHSEILLETARSKKIQNSNFVFFEMNHVQKESKKYELVSCFETLEHVGNLKNALHNLVNHVDERGILVITVPNEVKIPGIIKLLSRSILRRNPYQDFFDKIGYSEYLKALLSDSDITKFRDSERKGYGPHLGFDYRKMEMILNKLTENTFQLVHKSYSFMKMNVVFVYRKV